MQSDETPHWMHRSHQTSPSPLT